MARCNEVLRGRFGLGALRQTLGLGLGLALGLGGGLSGCDRREGPAEGEVIAPKGPDDARVVHNDFLGLIEDAKRKDAAAIMARLEKYLLTREELVVLFGPEVGEAAWAGYGGDIASKLRAEAPQMLIDRVAEGYTEVHVGGVGPAYPAATTPGDQRMLDALKKKRLMYSVWLRKPGEHLGLRFNGFIFHEGRWRALLKTYDHLPLPEPKPEVPTPVAPEGAAEDPPAEDSGAEDPAEVKAAEGADAGPAPVVAPVSHPGGSAVVPGSAPASAPPPGPGAPASSAP